MTLIFGIFHTLHMEGMGGDDMRYLLSIDNILGNITLSTAFCSSWSENQCK